MDHLVLCPGFPGVVDSFAVDSEPLLGVDEEDSGAAPLAASHVAASAEEGDAAWGVGVDEVEPHEEDAMVEQRPRTAERMPGRTRASSTWAKSY